MSKVAAAAAAAAFGWAHLLCSLTRQQQSTGHIILCSFERNDLTGLLYLIHVRIVIEAIAMEAGMGSHMLLEDWCFQTAFLHSRNGNAIPVNPNPEKVSASPAITKSSI